MVRFKNVINRIKWNFCFNVICNIYNAKYVDNVLENYFKAIKSPPTSEQIDAFECIMWKLVRYLEVKKYPNRKKTYLRDLNEKIIF